MTLPTLTVEIGFASDPLDDPQTWTDVSAYVRSVTTHRGRSTELDTFSPGTATVVLSNRDRRFDPEHASGPNYGNLLPNKAIRITCTYAAVSYPVFYGFVDGWPQTYNQLDATVALTCTDAFKLFSRRRLPESVYAYEVELDDPVVWLRLGDDGDRAADSSGHGNDGHYNGNEDHDQPSLIGASSDGSVETFGQVNSRVTIVSNTTRQTSGVPFAVEAWLQADTAHSGAVIAMQDAPAGSSVGTWKWLLDPTTGLRIESDGGAGGGATAVIQTIVAGLLTANIDDGEIHHVVHRRTATANEIYVDGAAVPTSSGVSPTVSTARIEQIAVGTQSRQDGVGGWDSWDGFIDEFAAYTTDLTATRIAAHYTAGGEPWKDDSTGARLERILDVIEWPASLRAIDAGEQLLDKATLASRTALDYAQALERTEQGRMFVARDGKVTFQSQTAGLSTIDYLLLANGTDFLTLVDGVDQLIISDTPGGTGTVSQATFTEDGSAVDYLITPFTFNYDETHVFNSVTVTREGGRPVTVTDDTSALTYGTLEKSITGVLLRSDNESRQVAESFLQRYKDPKTRSDSWAVRPNKNTANWPTVLALEIGYRVTLKRSPQHVGSEINLPFILESISHTITPGDWVITFTGSPADSISYFRWDSSLLDGSDVLR